MNTLPQTSIRSDKSRRLTMALLCLCGVLLNSLGSYLATALGLPLYLDSLGTMLSAVLGGYLPGIVVGYLSNLITSVSNASNAYYSSINALLAVLTVLVYRKGWFRRLPTILLSILAFAGAGGVLGSVITLLLSGFTFGDVASSPFAMWLSDQLGLVPASAQFLSDVLIDIADKAVVLTVALVILKFIPEGLRHRLHFESWKQNPISKAQRKALLDVKCRTGSLRDRLLVMLTSALLLIALASTSISVTQYHNTSIERFARLGEGVASVAGSLVPGDEVDLFLRKGESAPGYKDIENQLYQIRNSSRDIKYVYVYRIEDDGCHVVFDLDTEEEAGSNPGDIVDFDDDFLSYLPDLREGKTIPPVVSISNYGWLLTVYQPVFDSHGVCQCYAAADIDMTTIRSNEIIFLTKVISIFMGFFILILALAMWFTEYHLILPINSMAMAAGSFAYNSEGARTDSLKAIQRLGIRTGDELENLYRALEKTTQDMVSYIADVQEKNSTIAKMQDGLILVLADLVESRDKCTGDHVRKTAAYVDIIVHELKREGIYADQLTEEFMQDVVHSAPLHDIGKIHVPDSILNKPGKLTDEEFAQMKTHTTAGSEVIDNAIDTIASDSDAGYLKEARNLAAYHHEKWNGCGYPCGLSGEDIPLSARVMAVADVFDALVSNRSYKRPFTIDKALDIIREGAGSHFDPKVAQAFLNAEPEVRKVAAANMSKEKQERRELGVSSS